MPSQKISGAPGKIDGLLSLQSSDAGTRSPSRSQSSFPSQSSSMPLHQISGLFGLRPRSWSSQSPGGENPSPSWSTGQKSFPSQSSSTPLHFASDAPG